MSDELCKDDRHPLNRAVLARDIYVARLAGAGLRGDDPDVAAFTAMASLRSADIFLAEVARQGGEA